MLQMLILYIVVEVSFRWTAFTSTALFRLVGACGGAGWGAGEAVVVIIFLDTFFFMLQVLIFEVVAIIYQCFNGLFDEKIIMERSGTICATI